MNLWRIVLLALWSCVLGEPEGSHYYHNKKFYFSSEIKIWTEAKDACAQMQGSLFVPKQNHQTQFVMDILEVSGSEAFWWTGVNDRSQESRYVDTFDREITYTNWFPGHPPDEYNEQPTKGEVYQDCVELRRAFSNKDSNGPIDVGQYYWNDVTCDATDRHYICEITLCGFGPVPEVECSDEMNSAYGCAIDNHMLHTSTETLDTLPGETQMTCFMRCLSHVSCQSVNFDSSALSCQLISVRAESLAELISAQTSVYLSTNLC
ncbi:hypothetical protein CAPTEDRAFT_201237 [Capitella teleta]|uniref:C-type lectin domain-containing protein n=1 Tax=Capitella teleta TaxID=283909 RepID=R7V393_CAPTE|nr:hypothetical protein CAPTEDRAFT_201237 [Capitella teleta]|eukprot:ELU10260.1 hypothetical protein CAPTEDRAFT_201237 [Capitella teleta]